MDDGAAIALADELLELSSRLTRSVRPGGQLRQEGQAHREGAGLGGTTLAQMRLLRLVRRRPLLSVAEAADGLGVAPNTVSTLVGQLCALDLLHRVADGEDARVGRLRLAPEADRMMAAWTAQRLRSTAAAVGRLDEQDRRALDAALPALRRLSRLLAAPAAT